MGMRTGCMLDASAHSSRTGERRRSRMLWGLACFFVICWACIIRVGSDNDSAAQVSMSTGDERCYVFAHLQKAGGSTIKQILMDNWDSDWSTVYDSEHWEQGDAYTRSVANGLVSAGGHRAAMGGYTPALIMHGAQTCKWFTIFRHPIDRLVSAYYYCKFNPTDRLCASEVLRADGADLLTFAKHWGNFALRQFVLQMIPADDVMDYAKANIPNKNGTWRSGWYLQRRYMDAVLAQDSKEPDEALLIYLEPAKAMLKDMYAAVGILAHFDATLHLLNHALEMPNADWPTMFAASGVRNMDSTFHDEEMATLREAQTDPDIRRYIRLDMLLYEYAVDLFHAQVERYGIEI